MGAVHIWPTLAGVVALTPAVSYWANDGEIGKLRADLESGVAMAQAVGFSGSSCNFNSLVRVESKKGSPTIFVVARDFLGKAKEDFTFKSQADRDAFYQTFVRLLGPNWHCQQTPRSNRMILLLTLAGAVFGLLTLLCTGILLAAPPDPARNPGVQPMPAGAAWALMGFGLLVTAACVAWFFWARKAGGTIWETICTR